MIDIQGTCATPQQDSDLLFMSFPLLRPHQGGLHIRLWDDDDPIRIANHQITILDDRIVNANWQTDGTCP